MSSYVEEEELYVDVSSEAPATDPTGGFTKAGYLYKQGITIRIIYKLHETIVYSRACIHNYIVANNKKKCSVLIISQYIYFNCKINF